MRKIDLTDRDIEMFRALGESNAGNHLLNYLERVKTEYDKISNLEGTESVEQAIQQSKEIIAIIDTLLIGPIKRSRSGEPPDEKKDSYE